MPRVTVAHLSMRSPGFKYSLAGFAESLPHIPGGGCAARLEQGIDGTVTCRRGSPGPGIVRQRSARSLFLPRLRQARQEGRPVFVQGPVQDMQPGTPSPDVGDVSPRTGSDGAAWSLLRAPHYEGAATPSPPVSAVPDPADRGGTSNIGFATETETEYRPDSNLERPFPGIFPVVQTSRRPWTIPAGMSCEHPCGPPLWTHGSRRGRR